MAGVVSDPRASEGKGAKSMKTATTNDPTPLEIASADLAAFRERTAQSLIEAQYRSMAEALRAGRWPTGMWNSLTHWAKEATAAQDGSRHHESHKLAVVARTHLVTLAAAHGLRFQRDTEHDTTVMVCDSLTCDMYNAEVPDDDLGFHNGQHVTDPIAPNPTAYFAACAAKEDEGATRAEALGNKMDAMVHIRRAAWYRKAAEGSRRW